ETDALAKRFFAGKPPFRKCFADHDDGGSRRRVSWEKVASAKNGNAHRGKVAGRDDALLGHGRLAGLDRPAADQHAADRLAAPKRQLTRQADRQDAWDPRQALPHRLKAASGGREAGSTPRR